MGRFKGRTAVVTGAGSGIGRATAVLLAEEGAHVVANDIDADRAVATEAEIAAFGGSAQAVGGDVTEVGFLDALFADVVAKHGHLDVVHNNVGTGTRGSIVDLDDDAWSRGLDINLTAAFRGIRAALRIMQPQGNGAIVNTASLAGLRKVPGVVAYYGVAKAAVLQLTREAAIDGGAFGVRVNAVIPGSVRTPAFESYLGSPQAVDAYAEQIPLRRMVEPIDIARAVAFLASDDAAGITGIGLPIDGGYEAMLVQPEVGR